MVKTALIIHLALLAFSAVHATVPSASDIKNSPTNSDGDALQIQNQIANKICACITEKMFNLEKSRTPISSATVVNATSHCEKFYINVNSETFRELEKKMYNKSPEDSLTKLDWRIYESIVKQVMRDCKKLKERIGDTAAFYDSLKHCSKYGHFTQPDDLFMKKLKEGKIEDLKWDFQSPDLFNQYKKPLIKYFSEVQKLQEKKNEKPLIFSMPDRKIKGKTYITVMEYDENTDELKPLYQVAIFSNNNRFGKISGVEHVPAKSISNDSYPSYFPTPFQEDDHPCRSE